jgi:hypothetical protein
MCGSCGLGKVCDASGACAEPGSSGVCDPACGNRECGLDACGGTCGTCPQGKGCYQGFCVTGIACTPECTGRECGPDGCEGTCGACREGSTCGAGGKCVAGDSGGSTPGDNPCPAGQFMYGGTCVSEDPNTDPSRVPINDAVDAGDSGGKAACALGNPGPPSGLLLLLALGLALSARGRRYGS